MSETNEEQTYGEERRRELERMLRGLAGLIQELDARGPGHLLGGASELMRLIGDVRSELFHYEVRATYDTPEVAESRRIVRDAKSGAGDAPEQTWEKTEWDPARDADPEW
jgi:hypothetical protein